MQNDMRYMRGPCEPEELSELPEFSSWSAEL